MSNGELKPTPPIASPGIKPFPASFYDQTYKDTPLQTINESFSKLKPTWDRLILPWLPVDRNARIYEVACGSGITLRWMREHGYTNLSGSDISKSQIEYARAAGLSVSVDDSIQALRDMPANALDTVIAFNFYEHLTREMMVDFFGVAARVIKPGGCLIMMGPNGDSPVVGRALFNDVTHQWALTSYSFGVLLKLAGFRSAEFKDTAMASIRNWRAVKVPMIWAAQMFLRLLLRMATLERIECFTSSFFICARK